MQRMINHKLKITGFLRQKGPERFLFPVLPRAFPLLGSRGAFPRQGGPWAFTLVELIVVVTILALLATIGFVSYSSYLSGVRDTNRLSQLVAISDGLELYRTKKTLPIPDDNIEIRANGTVIGYQGYAGVNVLETIDYSKTGKDPKDKIHFSYYLTQDKKYYQLLTYLEEEENLETNNNLFQKTYADIDYTNRYPKVSGKKLGILTQSGTNIPVQEVTALISSGYLDIATTEESFVAQLTDATTINGTGGSLIATLPEANCNRIKQMGKSVGDGIYKINPTGTGSFKVYCDMTTDGGGWTMLFSVNPTGTTWKFDSTQWINPTISNTNLTDSNAVSNIEYTSLSYSTVNGNSLILCRGDLDNCYTMNHNQSRTLKSFFTSGDSYVDFSRGPSGELPDDVGEDKKDSFFTDLGLVYNLSSGYTKYGAGININLRNKIGFQGDNNNIWPSFDNKGTGIGNFPQHPGVSCSVPSPIASSNAMSINLPYDPCVYDAPDTKFWYVLYR